MSELIIKALTEHELDSVLAIEGLSFPDPWTEGMFTSDMRNELSDWIVGIRDGKIIGYAGYWRVVDEGHIMNIAVDPSCRRVGDGRRLMQAMFQRGADKGILYWTLEVRVSNTPAIRLYESMGFTCAGIRPNYYEAPKEDAAIMWKK